MAIMEGNYDNCENDDGGEKNKMWTIPLNLF